MSRTMTRALLGVLVLGLPVSAAADKNCPPKSGGGAASSRSATAARDGKAAAKEPVLDGTEIQVTYGTKGPKTVYRGRIIAIRLPGNREVGHWEITEVTGNAVKSLGKPEYVLNPNPSTVAMAGAFIFKFEAVELGRSTIKLLYDVPEKDRKHGPPNTFRFEISVRDPPPEKQKKAK